VQEQFARPVRLVVEKRSFLILGDRQVDEPQLAVAHPRERLVDRDVAAANRFDLRPGEREPDFERFQFLVLVARAAVVERGFGRLDGGRCFGRYTRLLHLRHQGATTSGMP
jgi:hypothetical protein